MNIKSLTRKVRAEITKRLEEKLTHYPCAVIYSEGEDIDKSNPYNLYIKTKKTLHT